LAAVRIDLVGTTVDFRPFGLRRSLPINHLLCENRRTAGRIGEDGLKTIYAIVDSLAELGVSNIEISRPPSEYGGNSRSYRGQIGKP
jgi:hypothetical protein